MITCVLQFNLAFHAVGAGSLAKRRIEGRSLLVRERVIRRGDHLGPHCVSIRRLGRLMGFRIPAGPSHLLQVS